MKGLGFSSDSAAYIMGTLKVKVAQSCLTLCNPMDCPWNFLGQNTGVGSLSFCQGNLPNPGIEPRSPTLQADSLPTEPQGKPKNIGMGSLSFLQQIFLLYTHLVQGAWRVFCGILRVCLWLAWNCLPGPGLFRSRWYFSLVPSLKNNFCSLKRNKVFKSSKCLVKEVSI